MINGLISLRLLTLHPDILNINYIYFDNMVKVNKSAHVVSNDNDSTNIYDKCDDFDFKIVNLPFLNGEVCRSTSYGLSIYQLIQFARGSSYVAAFNTRNKLLADKLFEQGYRYHKLC